MKVHFEDGKLIILHETDVEEDILKLFIKSEVKKIQGISAADFCGLKISQIVEPVVNSTIREFREQR